MVRKCRRGVTVMKGVDVRKRSVDEAAPHLDLQETSSSSSLAFSGKKRKINTGDHQFEFSTSYFNLRKRPRPRPKPKPRPRRRVILPETTRSSSSPSPCSYDNDISTLCYSTQLVDEYSIKFVDLKDENDEVEGVSYNSTRERRETTPSSQFRSEDMESTASEKIKNGAASSSVSGSEKMPTHSELEEFFITAEKDIQKRFTKKYNYDIAEDVPLEGRYEWVRLNP